jgi:hypothetical protein
MQLVDNPKARLISDAYRPPQGDGAFLSIIWDWICGRRKGESVQRNNYIALHDQ